jgi:hypothetical protein
MGLQRATGSRACHGSCDSRDDAGMLLRHETTPGYARLVRRRQQRRRISGRVASGLVAVGILAAFAVAAIAQPGIPTTFALGIGLVLYVLASFGLEEPPHGSKRSSHQVGAAPVRRPVDDVDWKRLDESIPG